MNITWAASPDEAEDPEVYFDLDAPPETSHQILPNLSFGIRGELEYQLEKNFDLDETEPDDLAVWDSSVSVALNYAPNAMLNAFFELEPAAQFVDDEEDKRDDETKFEFKQAFVQFDEFIPHLNLKAGRQRIKSRREWLYDDRVDGVRVFYARSNLAVDAMVVQKRELDLFEDDEDDDRATFAILNARYALGDDLEAGAYAISKRDDSGGGEDPFFFGLRLGGEAVNDLEYWLELSGVRGDTNGREIRAFGYDIGGMYEFDSALGLSLTLGYARGSGDENPMEGVDRDFRQTGLQDNASKLNGVARIKYYGELLDPELSNLGVLSAGIGVRPRRDLSFNLLYHHYRQDEAADAMRDIEVEDPTGQDRSLGEEIDFIMGYRTGGGFKGSLTLGYFMPGRAFTDEMDDAFFVEAKLRYSF